jgi:peptidoglycan hydrolase FlgJ
MSEIPLNLVQNSLPLSTRPAGTSMAIGRQKPASLGALKNASDIGNLSSKSADAEGLRKAAKEFEAVFMSQLLKQMRSTVHKEEMFNGGAGEEIFTEMLDEEFAQKMSAGQGAGIADMIYRQLSRQFGISESEQGKLPVASGSGDALQQKLQELQGQVRSQDPQSMSLDI